MKAIRTNAISYLMKILDVVRRIQKWKITKQLVGVNVRKKEYCIIFVIGEKDERHVIITARDAPEAVETFRQFERILFALCGYPNPTDVMVVRVFENEV